MKSNWLKFFVLANFAFWASGTARFVHMQIEHADVAFHDDDGCSNASYESTDDHGNKAHHDQTCFICNSLSAMIAHSAPAVVAPAVSLDVIATLIVNDWQSPTVGSHYDHSGRDPPAQI